MGRRRKKECLRCSLIEARNVRYATRTPSIEMIVLMSPKAMPIAVSKEAIQMVVSVSFEGRKMAEWARLRSLGRAVACT